MIKLLSNFEKSALEKACQFNKNLRCNKDRKFVKLLKYQNYGFLFRNNRTKNRKLVDTAQVEKFFME